MRECFELYVKYWLYIIMTGFNQAVVPSLPVLTQDLSIGYPADLRIIGFFCVSPLNTLEAEMDLVLRQCI